MRRLALALAALTAFTSAAFAQQFTLGDLVIDQAVARATAPGAKVGGGYLKITNNGAEADRLIGATAPFSGRVEIHEMKMENDVMRMKPVEGGLVIEPGATETLAPGGNHVMFMALSEALAKDEERAVVLQFEKSGEVEVVFKVKSIAETMEMNSTMKMTDEGEKDDESN